MADKTYKMTITLSDGSNVNAGTFVAPQGPKGDTGAQGPQGATGSQGPQGATGAQGEQGKSVFYSTAASGTTISAQSLMTDTISPLVGDIVIFPNGDIRAITAIDFDVFTCGAVLASIKGPKGDTGAQGPKGDTGATGPKGDKGDTGAQGPKGDKGAQGVSITGVTITEV